MSKILVTGAAGFIGFHLSKRLLKSGETVVGLDNLNDYYDVNLKMARLHQLESETGFKFVKMDLADREGVSTMFSSERFDNVVHLAAQAGVRYSLINPHAYIESNIAGFVNILEGCRHNPVNHLVFASSSSVYGANTNMPFSVRDNVDHPVSLYAATKKSNELLAHSYSSLYGIPVTGLRFFTVYGPWGRPDMALFIFTKAILEGKPINIFNQGNMKRDFTYISDIIEGLMRTIYTPAAPDPAWDGNNPDPSRSYAPYRLFNIGNNNPVDLMSFVEAIESELGKTSVKNFLPMQEGDVPATCADTEDLSRAVGFRPSTSIEEGIKNFINWYKEYYHI